MMRGTRSTLVLLVLFLALGGYAYFIESERAPASEADANEPVFDLEADAVVELEIAAEHGDLTRLERAAGSRSWDMRSPVEAAADDNRATAIASALESLEIERVVEADPADLEPFGLDDPVVDIGFRTDGDTALRRLRIGDTTPTGGDRYAQSGDDPRVFLIASFRESTFNRTTFDLRDRSILEFEGPDVDGLAIAGPAGPLRFRKADNAWRMVEPWDVRADFGVVEGLIGRLGSSEMRSIEVDSDEADGADLDPFGLGDPRVTASLELGSASAVLHVGVETEDAAVFARDASRDLVFTIDGALATDLERAAGAYRQKDLFSFRPFNADRLSVVRDDVTTVLEKTGGDDGDAWRRLEPEPADVDRVAVDDLLTKLSGLRAASFTDTRDATGLDAPLATVVVAYGEPAEEERVLIGRAGDAAYGAHGDEPGAGVLDDSAVDAALEALDAIGPVDAAP